MIRVILITSNSKRHQYFRIKLENFQNANYQIIHTFIENEMLTLEKNSISLEEKNHLTARNVSETDFFDKYLLTFKSKQSKITKLKKGDINNIKNVNYIIKQKPDLILTYGCSIIKGELLKLMENKIINVHLGISPYYLGSGTNFHALHNRDFQCVGYTFLYMDTGIDTGEIIHQNRAKIFPYDSPHQIGNRLILQMVDDMIVLIKNFKKIENIKSNKFIKSKIYYQNNFNQNVVINLYKDFSNAIIKYLDKRAKLEEKFPIIKQKFIK